MVDYKATVERVWKQSQTNRQEPFKPAATAQLALVRGATISRHGGDNGLHGDLTSTLYSGRQSHQTKLWWFL